MNNTIITIENLSKKYDIGKGQSGSLRETLSNAFRKAMGQSNVDTEEFWALRDINLEIKRGDAVGIIGRNGAGKSTLLKLLSKITYPSTGKITLKGRVSSLLEVGTGFHPELTGRENIFLNGTILGMSRKEVKSKFDEIVDFSGVERFLDTPVKRYSSGMYVRLAFAVAAHLEPEILIIDEVLAVGDIEFQKKCLGKMDEVAKGGRTVIFVSHNMGAIQNLCNKGVLLNNGEMIYSGAIDGCIRQYLAENKKFGLNVFQEQRTKYNDDFVKLRSLHINNKETVTVSDKIEVSIEYDILKEGANPIPNIHLFSEMGQKILISIFNKIKAPSKPGKYKLLMIIPANFLNSGTYMIGIALSNLSPLKVHAFNYEALTFNVMDNYSAITRNDYKGEIDGLIRPFFEWNIQSIELKEQYI